MVYLTNPSMHVDDSPVLPAPFEEHLDTSAHQTGFKNKPQ